MNIDIKDSFFVSLSLALHAKLWTGDKRLREYLIVNGRKELVITTHELLNIVAKV
ncbi:PIN domain-containing protein [Thermodesulfatator autotrophicus]|uniref:PIN domain-containing protein n=1 Tax=Thermodesulfatator autotrophicus TaxID=1795632 RepID=UPI0018D4ACA5